MNSFSPNYFIHVANVLLVVAYSVRDILWLRLFAVGASLISIPYFVLQPATLWAPLSWSVVFAAINLLQSWRLFIERRPVKLTPEEENIRRLVFEDFRPHLYWRPFGRGCSDSGKSPRNAVAGWNAAEVSRRQSRDAGRNAAAPHP